MLLEKRLPPPLPPHRGDEKKESVVFVTNHLKFGATTIAAIYRDRWQIEIFFKTLK